MFLKPLIDNDLVEDYKASVVDLISEQRIGPELRVQDFDDYICLLDGDVSYKLYIKLQKYYIRCYVDG